MAAYLLSVIGCYCVSFRIPVAVDVRIIAPQEMTLYVICITRSSLKNAFLSTLHPRNMDVCQATRHHIPQARLFQCLLGKIHSGNTRPDKYRVLVVARRCS
jgi:hypothetical protein